MAMQEPELDKADLVDAVRIAALCEAAQASPRMRAHLLLHAGHHDQVQRLLIALERGTYIPAHRHSEQWEMLVLLRGRVDILLVSDNAELQRRVSLDTETPVIQIPRLQCHCALSLMPGSLVMEVKPGPFRANEFMDWAPEEGAIEAGAFLIWALAAGVGDTWRR